MGGSVARCGVGGSDDDGSMCGVGVCDNHGSRGIIARESACTLDGRLASTDGSMVSMQGEKHGYKVGSTVSI